jgi:phospholipid/cholesterol/gamma-HCH transport system substrate-binding protein
METKARYILVGVFTLAAFTGAFIFIYWLQTTGGLVERTFYRIQFESPVAGLRPGSAVMFNGVRVGEITNVQINPDRPRQVLAMISIEKNTPIRQDTYVGMDFQGLTGVASVALKGGTPDSPPFADNGKQPPLLMADPAASQDVFQATRDVLRRVDSVMAENSEALHSTITNLNTFSGALARNSGQLDDIVAGLVRMTGGAPGKEPPVYDLTAPRAFPPFDKALQGQLIVPDPTALIMFDTRKIIVRPAAGESAPALDGQWSDTLPKLVQAKIVQALENSKRFQTVGKPMEIVTADYQLLIDIRSFQISLSPNPVAEVEFSVRIAAQEGGRIVDTRIFQASVQAKAVDAAAAAAALDEAFGKAASDLVAWTSEAIRTPPRIPSRPLKRTSIDELEIVLPGGLRTKA